MTSATNGRKPGGFLHRLEALRGVAAMMVAAGHSLLLVDETGWQLLRTKLCLIPLNGRAAVSLFFVLSGLVLGLALRRVQGGFWGEFRGFATRRVCRLYPALAVSIGFITAGLLLAPSLRAPEAAGVWFHDFFGAYATPVTGAAVWRNLLLLSFPLNPPTWTLQTELLCSLLLPFLHWSSLRASAAGKVALLLGAVALSLAAPNREAGKYLFMFYLGYLLPEFGPKLFARIRRGRWGILLAGLATVALLGALRLHGALLHTGVLIEGLAAGLLVAGLLYGREFRVYRFLDLPVVKFYGRISYSFYLFHFPSLFVVAHLGFWMFPAEAVRSSPLAFGVALWLVSTGLATPLAWLSHRYVEVPFIALAKRSRQLPRPTEHPAQRRIPNARKPELLTRY